jgi:beta-fructofuranosidase
MFYQFDPVVRGSRNARTWAHAVSTDLVHWEDWPIAIWPDKSFDRGGVYSGNTFIFDDGELGAIYTGNARDPNMRGGKKTFGVLARSKDEGLTCTKKVVMHDVDRPNPDSPVHWDSQIWSDGETWYQLIGGTTGGDNGLGAAWLWTSPDLDRWTLLGNIAPTIERTGFWELPYLISLGGRHVLMVGQENPYWIGTYDPKLHVFTPDNTNPFQIDTGNYYAVNPHMVDNKGLGGSERRLLNGWITGPASPSNTVPYWQGALALPRVLTLKENRLWQEPIQELRVLRGCHHRFENHQAALSGLLDIEGDSLELRATFNNTISGQFGLKLRVSNDGSEFVRVFYDIDRAEFGVDGPTIERNAEEHQTGLLGVKLGRQEAFQKPGGPVTLHVFLDRSIIEVFVDGCVYTARAFPASNALGVKVWIEQDSVQVDCLDVWEMNSIWDD